MEFQDRSYIWGLNGATPNVDPARVVSFTDPFSSMTYYALTFEGKGAAEAMLAKANALYARSSLCDSGAGDVCVEPSFLDETFEGGPTLEELAEQARNRTTEELRQYVQLIKVNEKLSREMFGDVYIGNPYNP